MEIKISESIKQQHIKLKFCIDKQLMTPLIGLKVMISLATRRKCKQINFFHHNTSISIKSQILSSGID